MASNGYSRLKARYEQLQEQKAELLMERDALQATIEKQQTRISELTATITNKESDIKFYAANAKNYWNHMGLFRQWLWIRKHG